MACRCAPRSTSTSSWRERPRASARSGGNRRRSRGVQGAVVVRPLNLADGELVKRAKRGDVGAYEQIVERYREPVFRVAFLVTRSNADAEEAAQDAFVKAYRALGRFRADAPLRPWLMRIAVNESRNRLRSA